MRLRRKPWIEEVILDYKDFVFLEDPLEKKGNWQQEFSNKKPIYVELGVGKGNFISQVAKINQDINYIGIEIQLGVLYYAAKKVRELNLENVRILKFDVTKIEDIFANGEVDRFYINFCDPWPKARHYKRRLTYRGFLGKYKELLTPNGQIHFKTDNEALFEFSLLELKETGWHLDEVFYDLHQEKNFDNIMTEYESKFSAKGNPIYYCVASK